MSAPDPDHSDQEDREITIGYSTRQRLPFVSHGDTLRSEYDLSRLKGGVRGKYYREATAGTNLVLVEPDLAKVFPDTESVNRALRLLVDTAAAAMASHRRRAPNKRVERSA